MTDGEGAGGPIDRDARIRALEAARGVAFRHMVARFRKDIRTLLGCQLTSIDADGGRIELQPIGETGEQTLAALGADAEESERVWLPFLSVATLVARRRGTMLTVVEPDDDQDDPQAGS